MFAPDRMGLRTNTDDVIVWVRAWDLAGSKEGDWTVGVMTGLTRDRKVVVGNVRRLRGGPEVVADAIAETARADIAMGIDPGQAGLAQKDCHDVG